MENGWARPRPALDRRLDGALTHRLTTVVAAAGYGKSTILGQWVRAVGGATHRLGPADRDPNGLADALLAALRSAELDLPPEIVHAVRRPLGPDANREELVRAEALAGAVTEALAQQLRRDFALVLDDVDAIVDAPAAVRFIETLVRTAPRRLHIVTASRDVLPFPIARLRQDHDVLILDATDLTLDAAETAQWLGAALGPAGAALAPAVHAACGGWPAAVHAAVDALARADPATWAERVTNLAAHLGSPERLAEQAHRDLPDRMRWLLRAATVLPVLTDELVAALDAPPEALATLRARGPFLEPVAGGHQLTPMSRHVLARLAPLDRPEAYRIAAVAADWYLAHGEPGSALRVAVAADHLDLIGALVREYGPQLVERPDDLLAAIDRLPEAARDAPDLLRLTAIAQQNRGEWQHARDLLVRAAEGPAFDASVAWRLGFIDYLRGDLAPALAVCRRGMAYGAPAGDAAMCAAIAAAVCWLTGDRDGSAELADRALAEAAAAGDSRAQAAAHTALAMLAAYDGDRRANDAHYLRAVEHADRAGDVIQQIRIRANRGSHFLEEGAYPEALAELDTAGRLAEFTSFAPLTALVQSNRAETLIRLGRLEEAAVVAGEAVERWTALGSRLVGYGLNQLALIQTLRGDRSGAIATYRRGIAEAEGSGEVHGSTIALAGLAVLLAPDDPRTAAELAAKAMASGNGITSVTARLAAATVARAAGRADEARGLLDAAVADAVAHRDRAGLAAIAELRAALDADPDRADEAVRGWGEIGDPIGLARAELVRAGFDDPERARQVAEDVRARMRAIGCRLLDPEIEALLARATPVDARRVEVETLGAFRVLRDGTPVPRGAWQSRKARDLLKILIARQGRPVPREQLVALLWPDDAQDRLVGLRRLKVIVSMLRGVLDPDRDAPRAPVLLAEAGALRLDLSRVAVDVEDFLNQVAAAAALDRAGQPAEALDRWRAAEAAYLGDFCAEDAYAEWAAPLREQARLGYVQAAARVAQAEAAAGNHEQAARLWLRLLERDRYDERAHLALIRVLHRAGRHGDARRRYRGYAELMRELNVEPSPYPAEDPVRNPTGVPDLNRT